MSKFMCIVKESEPLIDKLRLTVMHLCKSQKPV